MNLESDFVLKTISDIRAYYDESIFTPPKPGCPVDCYSAGGARIALDLLVHRLQEHQHQEYREE